MWRRLVVSLPLALLLAAACAAQPQAEAPRDPLQSPDCRKAMATLNAEEAASAPGRAAPAPASAPAPTIPPRLAALRRAAARACLGTHADVLPAPQRPLRPPVSVQAPPLPSAAAVPRVPSPAIPPAKPPERPAFVTSCDPGGCWASDGTRLQRAGPNLIGPRGICTKQGTVLSCP